VMGAGVVVALQDVIASIGGWFAISFSSLYRVGDRIQIGDTKGDVIDISVLRTTVMETGNWVSGDLYNGRISRIPNSFVLKGFVFNYSQGFRFVWDEVKIRLAFESNHLHAREVLLRLAKETVTDNLLEAQTSWNRIAENYRIETPVLEPTVTLVISDGSIDALMCLIGSSSGAESRPSSLSWVSMGVLAEGVRDRGGAHAWRAPGGQAVSARACP